MTAAASDDPEASPDLVPTAGSDSPTEEVAPETEAVPATIAEAEPGDVSNPATEIDARRDPDASGHPDA